MLRSFLQPRSPSSLSDSILIEPMTKSFGQQALKFRVQRLDSCGRFALSGEVVTAEAAEPFSPLTFYLVRYQHHRCSRHGLSGLLDLGNSPRCFGAFCPKLAKTKRKCSPPIWCSEGKKSKMKGDCAPTINLGQTGQSYFSEAHRKVIVLGKINLAGCSL